QAHIDSPVSGSGFAPGRTRVPLRLICQFPKTEDRHLVERDLVLASEVSLNGFCPFLTQSFIESAAAGRIGETLDLKNKSGMVLRFSRKRIELRYRFTGQVRAI